MKTVKIQDLVTPVTGIYEGTRKGAYDKSDYIIRTEADQRLLILGVFFVLTHL